MPLRTVIVEDEPLSRQYIHALLKQIPAIEIIATAATEDEAVEKISSHRPDMVFMDLELHTGTGFEVLRKLKDPSFNVVFTTALDHYALKIIRLSGMPYLQKPIDAEELAAFVLQAAERKNNVQNGRALTYLLETLNNNNVPLHFAVMNNGNCEYALPENLLAVEAKEKETILLFRDGESKNSSLSLKDYEYLLGDYSFCRVNATYLINLKEIKDVNIAEGFVIMKTGKQLELSSKKRNELITRLAHL